MKAVTLSAITLIAISVSGTAFAQNTTQPPGKLFFEGDIVRHRGDKPA